MFNKIKQFLFKDLIPVEYSPMAQLLILINITVFILQLLIPPLTETYIFRSNIWYSYITSCFLHGSIMHLAGNMLFFSFIVPPLEKNYGSLFIFLSYIFTGIFGGLLQALFQPNIMALGASGSICGLMMLWIFHQLKSFKSILIFPALFYLMLQGIQSGLSLVIPQGISFLAHYGSTLSAFLLLPFMFIFKRISISKDIKRK